MMVGWDLVCMHGLVCVYMWWLGTILMGVYGLKYVCGCDNGMYLKEVCVYICIWSVKVLIYGACVWCGVYVMIRIGVGVCLYEDRI